MNPTTFKIEDCTVVPDRNVVLKNGEEIRLEPKLMQVLWCLYQRRNEVVKREDLMDEVWKGTIVVDVVLTRAISGLRKIFNDSPHQSRIIETVSKAGYRLILPDAPPVTEPSVGRNTKPFIYQKPLKAAGLVILAVFPFVLFSIFSNSPDRLAQMQPFTAQKGWEFHPSVSPDRSQAAYVWRDDQSKQGDIFVKSLDGSKEFNLTQKAGTYFRPRWSPDGSKIAYSFVENGKAFVEVRSLLGGTAQRLFRTYANGFGLCWATDGQLLFFIDRDSAQAPNSIFLSQSDGALKKQITFPPPSHTGDGSPEISPDGKYLAFVRTLKEGDDDIFMLDLENLQEHRLTETHSNIFGISWDKNGPSILFASNKDGPTHLWKIKANIDSKAKPERLQQLSLRDNFQNPVVFGDQVLVEKWTTDTDLQCLSLNGQPHMQHIGSSFWELHPAFSPDGQRVAFSSQQSGHFEIWEKEIGQVAQRQLTHFQSGFTAYPAYSPDGKTIALCAQQGVSSDIYLMRQNRSEPMNFTKSPSEYLLPFWSGDGNHLFYASNRSGNWQIWRQGMQSDHPIQITSDSGYRGALSKDDKQLFFTKHLQNGLWSLDLETQKEQLLLPDLFSQDWGNWAAGGTGIYFIRRNAAGADLCLFSFAENKTEMLQRLTQNVPYNDPAFAVAPDGGWFLVGDVKRYFGDLVVVRK